VIDAKAGFQVGVEATGILGKLGFSPAIASLTEFY
jgi:hypothetical protein